MNATHHAIQEQGRIKRQMKEQEYAVPINDLVFDRSKGFMKEMMDRMTDKLASEIDWKNWEDSPVVRYKQYGDKIKLDHIPREKFYKQTSGFSNTMSTDQVWPLMPDVAKNETTEIELTFKDGVFI